MEDAKEVWRGSMAGISTHDFTYTDCTHIYRVVYGKWFQPVSQEEGARRELRHCVRIEERTTDALGLVGWVPVSNPSERSYALAAALLDALLLRP